MSDDFPDEATENAPGRKSILTNSAWLVGGRLLVAVIQWSTTLLIIRTLTVDEFGEFSLVFGILGMLSIVTDMGLGRVAVSMLQSDESDKAHISGAYIVLRLLLGFLGYLIAVVIVAVGGFGTVTLQATLVGAITVIFATASSAYSVIFQVKERLQLPAISTMIGACAQMLAVLLLIRGGDTTVVLFMVPAVLAAFLDMVIKGVGAHRLAPIHYCIDTPLWWHLLKEAVPMLPFRSSENRRVVEATVEDADNHQHLVEDGKGDGHSATKADRPQTWPNVVTGFASVREEGQLLTEGDDRIRVTVSGFR